MAHDGMPRAYLRIDPNLDQVFPELRTTFVGLLCAAGRQPDRGRFRDRRLLNGLVGRVYAAHACARGDVVPLEDGRLYVVGWDEWQEGDLTVAERMRRMRAKRAERNARNGGVTPAALRPRNVVTTDAVSTDSSTLVPLGDGDGGGVAGARAGVASLPTEDWFTAKGPEDPAITWLARHRATVEPNGKGLHPILIELVESHGIEKVLAAFETLAAEGCQTPRQFVFGTDNRLNPIPTAVAPVEEPWERDIRETRERIEAKHEAARQAGQAGQTP